MTTLAEEEREAIALRFGAELTVPEMADLLGLPLSRRRAASTAPCASCASGSEARAPRGRMGRGPC